MPMDTYDFKEFQKIIKGYIRSNKIHNNNKGIILALIGPKTVGLVSYVLLDRLNQHFPEFWIPELVVSKEYRRRGIGNLLIHKCKQAYKPLQRDYLILGDTYRWSFVLTMF